MKLKKIVCGCMSVLMMASFVACSGSAGPTGTADTAASTPAGGEYNPTAPSYESYLEMDGTDGGEDDWRYAPIEDDEEYDDARETPFKNVSTSPLSTFSSDVDTASYSNMRRFINARQRPEGVRIEELVNYFSYEYERPAANAEHPFTVTSEVAPCPWNEEHLLAMIGVQGAEMQSRDDINNNIVFLLDVSGSMDAENKLPLLRESFKLLIKELDENDRISIVTYAGSDKIVADSVSGAEHKKLERLMDKLSAGGSTAGAQGLRTAYQLAEKNFMEGGNNRIILATDGDFNVGESSTAAMTDLIETEREKGIFISVLGFGMGNLKDNMMETIADCGNGNYAYIDNLAEAQKVLVDEFDSTMFVIAKDLKLQVEFNGAVVSQYRLIGYNNRRLEDEDFNDDRKDAGDVGAGHSVTAFYELVLVGTEGPASVDGLKYRDVQELGSDDFMTVKVRYKLPNGEESRLVEAPVVASAYTAKASRDFSFASSVVEFGLILTDSDYRGTGSVKNVLERAAASRGADPYGLREEFVDLVAIYRDMTD